MDQTILERGCVTQVKDYGDYFAGSCTEAASTARNSKFGENPIHASGDLSKFGKQQVGSELPAGVADYIEATTADQILKNV